MATLNKIDSNITGLRYAQEASLGVLPATPRWDPLEPNSYNDFGGNLTLLARNPINPSRQRKKGVITDLDASGGFNTDLTQANLQDMLQGFFFATSRQKENHGGSAFNIVDTATINAAGTGYTAGDILTVAGGYSRSGRLCTIKADTVGGSGELTAVSIVFHGEYEVNPTLTANPVTGGTGTGATINLAMLLSKISTVVAATDDYTAVGGLGFAAGELIFASGFTNAANNGLKRITSVTSDTTVTVAEALVDETPPAGAKLMEVGFQFATGTVNVDVTGSLPKLVRASGAKDFTDFGLIPGEWLYIGGDTAGTSFVNAVNNGFARVLAVTQTSITFDKTSATMVAETGTGLTVQLFFGRVIRNELGTDIVRRTYQLERTLGAPDSDLPLQVQSEYLVGAVPSELTLNVATADKINADISFVAIDNEQRTGAEGVKSGTRPSLVEADAFNTSSDFSRIKMAQVVSGNPYPNPLFAFVTDLTLGINNNVSPNKAVGVLGAFEVTAGTFAVSGNLTAYFSNVAAVQAVRDNADITLDMVLVKANSGIVFDVPLISLGDGRATVEQDQPITLPVSIEAATAAKIDATLDYTLLMEFFDYLPDAAG